MPLIAGRNRTLTLASDVRNDGMSMELSDDSGAFFVDVHRDDATGHLTLVTGASPLPLQAVEWLIEAAKKPLTPSRGDDGIEAS